MSSTQSVWVQRIQSTRRSDRPHAQQAWIRPPDGERDWRIDGERIGWAWVGFGFVAIVTLIWGATTPIGIGTAALLMAKQFPILMVGAFLASGLRRTGSSIHQLTAERSRRPAELDAFATPLMSLLVSGAPLSDDDRREFAVAEAELRYGLGGAVLLSAPSSRPRGAHDAARLMWLCLTTATPRLSTTMIGRR